MFNYGAIDKTPTVAQIKAIIQYMEDSPKVTNNFYDFSNMMDMKRPEPNKILLNLNNAHRGINYEILFNDNNEIVKFEQTSNWMS